ncbi:MAG: hypothetical protein JRH20_07695 [Deltaproteobacteria bacterium]|nr:hypothetical protein [Deltaproteobacteria bacterium]
MFGLLLGLAGLGGLLGYQYQQHRDDPCLARCGLGTSCEDGLCEVEPARKKKGKKRRKRGRRHRRHASAGGKASTPDGPTAKQPTAADLASISRGPRLGGTDRVQFGEEDGTTELSTDEVGQRFRRLDDKILGCIDRARGDYEVTSGKVAIGFRVERSGQVKKVRITAPALMQRAGLSACVSSLVRGLRFRRSSRALVMTYPYALR